MADGSRLSIDLNSGTIQVEGDAELAREVYRDFRDRLAEYQASAQAEPEPAEPADDGGAEQTASQASKVKKGRRARASSASGKKRGTSFSPQRNPHLDLKGLEEFYDQYQPKNHNQKILVFVEFLRDQLEKEQVSGHDVYTCYLWLKSKTQIPKVFQQAFYNARNDGLIDFETFEDITVPIHGTNTLEDMKKRAGAE